MALVLRSGSPEVHRVCFCNRLPASEWRSTSPSYLPSYRRGSIAAVYTVCQLAQLTASPPGVWVVQAVRRGMLWVYVTRGVLRKLPVQADVVEQKIACAFCDLLSVLGKSQSHADPNRLLEKIAISRDLRHRLPTLQTES